MTSLATELRSRPARRRPRGLTLIEMMISLAIVSVILLASGSLVMVAARTISSEQSNPGSDAAAARSATSRIIEDLKMATAVSEQTVRTVTMTVPDRDSDGNPETIRYAWSGVAGDPLTRTYNGVTATMTENVRALNFTYLSKTAGKPSPVEGSEVVQSSHVALDPSKISQSDLTTTKAMAEYFMPTLSTKAVSWKVTRCRIQMQQNTGSLGTVTVALRYADSNFKPTGANLQAQSFLITLAPLTASWIDLTFSSPGGPGPDPRRVPGDHLCRGDGRRRESELRRRQ